MVDGRVRSGKASAEKMTAEQRKERAMKGVEARKAMADLPKAAYQGVLNIGDMSIPCAVLEDGRRVISEMGILSNLGTTGGKGRKIRKELEQQIGVPIPIFLASKALEPFIYKVFDEGNLKVIDYVNNGTISKGYDATILPKVCEIWLMAREANVLQESQLPKVQKAEILMRGLAHVGITALVDEATGYQAVREKDDLAKIFEAFVAKELQPWIKTFPDDYYKELFRLYELPQPEEGNMSKPQFFGKVTNKVIYKKLAPNVLPELKKQAAKLGKKSTRLHQALTPEKGHPDLLRLVSSVTTIAKLSKDKNDFFEKVDIIHPDFDENYVLEI